MYEAKTGRNAGKRNRKRIEKFLEENPTTNGVKICEALGLSRPVVYKHLAAICKDYKEKQNG